MRRATLIAAVLLGCQPKQPLQASFFNAEKEKKIGPQCSATLACYGQCNPVTEECMLLCDQKAAHPRQAELARAVTYCSAQHGCGDDPSCIDAKCSKEKQMCVAPNVAPAPSRMAPKPYPGQHYAGTPPTPPYPGAPHGQAAATTQPGQATAPTPPPPPPPMQPPPVMQPQPYPGQPTTVAPRPMAPPPVMQPQPYPGQPGYRPAPPPAGYRPPPPPPPPAYRPPPPPYPTR